MSSTSTNPDSSTLPTPQTTNTQPRARFPVSVHVDLAPPFDRTVPPGVVAESDVLDPALATAVRAYSAMPFTEDNDDQGPIPSPHPTYFIHDRLTRNAAAADIMRLILAGAKAFDRYTDGTIIVMVAPCRKEDETSPRLLYRSRGIVHLLQGAHPENPVIEGMAKTGEIFNAVANTHQRRWRDCARQLSYTTDRDTSGQILALNGRVSNGDLLQLSNRITNYLHQPFGPFSWVRSSRPMLPAVPFVDETVGMDECSDTSTTATSATIFYETQPSVTLGQVVTSYLAATRHEFVGNEGAQASGVARFKNQRITRDQELMLLGMGVTPLDQLHLRLMLQEEPRDGWEKWMAAGNIQLRDLSLIPEIISVLQPKCSPQ